MTALEVQKKKKKKEHSPDEPEAPTIATGIEKPVDGEQEKKKKKKRCTAEEAATDPVDVPTPPTTSFFAEDAERAAKRARKEAKRAEKEQKAAAAAAAPANAEVCPEDEKFRTAHHITVSLSAKGEDTNSTDILSPFTIPSPIKDFHEKSWIFSSYMREALHVKAGFQTPSPIQAQSWPIAKSGRDLIAVAKTGSGKTLAFLVPSLEMIVATKTSGERSASRHPSVVVLAPTRELVVQIEEACRKFAPKDVVCACFYGGVPKGPQVAAAKAGTDIILATPGRLVDLLSMPECQKTGALAGFRAGSVKILVLDEADRMLDMGFEPQMKQIMSEMSGKGKSADGTSSPAPSEEPSTGASSEGAGADSSPSSSAGRNKSTARQTILFSATWPKSVRKLAASYLTNPIHLNVGETKDLAANKAVSQKFFALNDEEKDNKLWQLLEQEVDWDGIKSANKSKVIVFCNTKNRVDRLSKTVKSSGFKVAVLSGDRSQQDRNHDLALFASGEAQLMIATDVCARGLDIKDVSHVMNYDMARDVESYIHRIGRTGRAGAFGTSFTFVNEDYDVPCSPALAKIAQEAGQEVPSFLQKLVDKASKGKVNKLWKY